MNPSDILNLAFISALLAASVRFATPLLMAALGEVFAERSGVLNLGLEGVMSGGAFAGFLVAYLTKNLLLAFCAAVAAGILLGLVLSLFYITLRANQVVIGILFNFLMVGITGYSYRLFFADLSPRLNVMDTLSIPLLRDIPLLGPALFDHSPITYLSLLLVPLVGVILYKTGFGLKLRAVGEHPQAADTLGVHVLSIRYLSLLIAGGLGGAGGAFVSLSFGSFYDTMLAGRGFIAVALVIFGRWNPFLVLLGALLFGFVDALALRLQAMAVPIPHQFLLMLPYVLTIFALLVSRNSKLEVGTPGGPKGLMVPYER